MLTVSDVSLRFSDRKLFDDVNIKFTEGNTYGLIGANGAGKSTFLKILAGDIEPTTGHISLGPDERLSVLRQNHFDYEDERAIDVVIMGNEKLYSIMKEKDAIYMKEDFSDEDGVRAAELEGEFAELGGWEAESEASQLLQNLNLYYAMPFFGCHILQKPQKLLTSTFTNLSNSVNTSFAFYFNYSQIYRWEFMYFS